jgi:hypothetical protein
MTSQRPEVRPIGPADADDVAAFLHAELNGRVPLAAWRAMLQPRWRSGAAPNSGFLLRSEGLVVGVYAAVYADRDDLAGAPSICNLAAFVVAEEHRSHSLRLVRALLGQKGYVFTDLSPSGNVPAMNERLGFRRLDTRTRLILNPGWGARGERGDLLVTHEAIRAVLGPTDRRIFDDHRGTAARHLVIRHGDRYAYLVYRRDRRKRLAVFATPLYVGGDASLLAAGWGKVSRHLLRRGFAATLAEPRILRFTPLAFGRWQRQPRPRMVKGDGGGLSGVDYLYSEMALLEW